MIVKNRMTLFQLVDTSEKVIAYNYKNEAKLAGHDKTRAKVR